MEKDLSTNSRHEMVKYSSTFVFLHKLILLKNCSTHTSLDNFHKNKYTIRPYTLQDINRYERQDKG